MGVCSLKTIQCRSQQSLPVEVSCNVIYMWSYGRNLLLSIALSLYSLLHSAKVHCVRAPICIIIVLIYTIPDSVLVAG